MRNYRVSCFHKNKESLTFGDNHPNETGEENFGPNYARIIWRNVIHVVEHLAGWFKLGPVVSFDHKATLRQVFYQGVLGDEARSAQVSRARAQM